MTILQVIIGSYPHGDGTFDKANDFQSVVVDGAWTMGLATAKLHAGQVAYIVPAAKGGASRLCTPRVCLLSWVPLRHTPMHTSAARPGRHCCCAGTVSGSSHACVQHH